MDKYLFEQKFRLHLKNNDYSQSRLARKLHVSRSTVSKWITGENQISYEALLELCKLFDLDSENRLEFMALAGYQPVTEQPSSNLTPIVKRQSYDAILYQETGNLRRPPRLFGFLNTVPEINSYLDQGEHVLITGYGGTGKTALAATIADMRIAEGKGPILWLSAHTENIDTLFEALLVPLNAHQELINLNGDALLYAVKKILTRESIQGVVLDDLRTIRLFAKIRQAMPDHMALLITSRHTITNVDHIFPVPTLTLDEATAFLASQAANSIISELDYRNSPQATVLCERLKLYPLGIGIAGAWLKRRKLPIEDLLARLDASNMEPLTIEMPPEFHEEGRETVKFVLDQTYRELSKTSQALFRSFGVLQEPHVTADFLETYAGLDTWTIQDALDELVAWNFVAQTDDTLYSMHDMIHLYAEFRTRTIRHVESKRLVTKTMEYVATNATAFQKLYRNLPNILFVAEASPDEDCLQIIARLALDGYQDSHGHRLLYLELLDRVLAFQYEKHGQGALDEGELQQFHHLLSKRGNAYFDRIEYQNAVDTYHQAFTYAYNDERRAILLGLLGKSLRFYGDFAKSEQSFQRAYQVAREADNSFLLSFILEQHAYAAGYHGDHETARRVVTQQVHISEQLVQSEPTPQNLTRLFYALNNLATAERHVGEKSLHDILQIVQRAEALATEIQRDEIKAHAAWALAEIFHALGDRDQTMQYLHRALSLYEEQGKILDIEQIKDFMRQNGYR